MALGDKIWQGARFVAMEAEVGYNNRLDGPGVGCGGVCLWVSLLISHVVCEVGKSRSGWAQWMRLTGTPGGEIAIINVYALN